MNRRFSPRPLARSGLFAALIILCTYITVPLPTGVPLTLQTFALALAGFLLGPAYGVLAVLCYLLLGAAGLPVFSGFAGGVGRFFGPTGGFLWGFPLLALGCGLGRKRPFLLRLLPGMGGLLLCHLLGAAWYARSAALTLPAAALAVSLPFLPKDLASLVLALLFARALERRRILR